MDADNYQMELDGSSLDDALRLAREKESDRYQAKIINGSQTPDIADLTARSLLWPHHSTSSLSKPLDAFLQHIETLPEPERSAMAFAAIAYIGSVDKYIDNLEQAGRKSVRALVDAQKLIEEQRKQIVVASSTQAHLEQRVETLSTDNTKLFKKATTDPLTGAYNRRYFDKQLEQEVEEANRYKTPFSLLIFDLDHFKHINDSFGHPAGDYVLKEFTKLIQLSVRKTDIFARIGGEEFVIIAPQTDEEHAYLLGEKLRGLTEHHDFVYNNMSIAVTASIGVAQFRPGEAAKDLFDRADRAVYHVKHNGRNDVQPYGALP